MANEYLRLTDTNVNIEKAQNFLAIVEDKRKDPTYSVDMKSENSLFSELFKAFKDFFSNLGKPTVKKKLLKEEAPARSSDYNDRMTEINNDIHVAYTETDSLSSVIVKDFNYSETERQMLVNKVKKLASDSTDYSFYSEGAKTQSLYGIDSFSDNSKVDLTRTTPGVPSAELVSNQGVVTLKRSGNIDRNSLVTSVTGIKESIPSWDASNEKGGYEGLYFGLKNEARPEGGSFHVSYSQDGSRLYENGASEEEKMPRRMNMFDNNADTFWEVEYITNPIVGYKDKYSGKQISVAEFNSLVNNEVSSPNANTSGGTIVTNEHGSLIENYVPVTTASTSDYLTCSFIVHLSKSEIINWISLNPNNFGQELYMEILSIQTSEDGQSFVELEGFDDYEYATVLTKKANSELNPMEVQDTLSPDKFKYAGQGVWVFAPRPVVAIKFTLRQTRSYLKEYNVLMVETEQTVTTTTEKSSFWGLIKSTSTDSSVVQSSTEVPYLTSQVMGFDVLSLEPGSTVNTNKEWGGASDWSSVGAVIDSVLNLSTLFLFGGSKKTSTTSSPQRITKQWIKTKNDRARFALGIRDINIYSYKFASVSEVVSKPFTSPKPISKVSLSVEEQVPKIFYTDSNHTGTENDWIKYYISVDNGTSWRRISPSNHRSTMSDDGVNFVPEIININSDIASSERSNPLAYIDSNTAIYDVRFKAVLSRPTDIEDAESYTPVLSQYALQIYPLGGL